MRCAASGSSMIALSVISRHSADGGSAVARAARSRRRSRAAGSTSWRGERLTAITKSSWPAARHAAAWRQASSSTHSPIGTISAALLGDRDEARGGDRAALRVLPAQQRLDAEQPRRSSSMTRAGSASDELAGGERVAQLGLELEALDARACAASASKNSSCAWPCSLAWYIAASASRSSSSARRVGAVGDARCPMLALTEALAAVERERALERLGDPVGDPAQVGAGS